MLGVSAAFKCVPEYLLYAGFALMGLGCIATIIALVKDITEWYQNRGILFVKAVDQAHEDRKLEQRSKTLKEFTETPWFRRIKRLGWESHFGLHTLDKKVSYRNGNRFTGYTVSTQRLSPLPRYRRWVTVPFWSLYYKLEKRLRKRRQNS